MWLVSSCLPGISCVFVSMMKHYPELPTLKQHWLCFLKVIAVQANTSRSCQSLTQIQYHFLPFQTDHWPNCWIPFITSRSSWRNLLCPCRRWTFAIQDDAINHRQTCTNEMYSTPFIWLAPWKLFYSDKLKCVFLLEGISKYYM